MLTNQGRSACWCICFLLLLGLCYGLDHWSLSGGIYQSHGNFEIDRENEKIIVTITNAMYHLDLELSTQLSNVMEVGPEESAADFCYSDFRPDHECQNYPRVLVLPGGVWTIIADNGTEWDTMDTILSCRSNAFSPLCYYRRKSDLELLTTYSGSRYNPFGPSSWVPGIWISTGRLIVAAPQDALFTRFGITMSEVPFNGDFQSTTRINQRLWFNKTPIFVSMYEIGEYVYVFFREEAVEANERVVYSRVARICKDDTGSTHERTTIFTTFIKARIICTNAGVGGFVYNYNDLYATYYQPEEQRLYAVFRTPLNAPLGSVVCSYTFGANQNDLETVFSGDYLVEEATDSFATQRNFNPFTCSGGRDLMDALRIQLMATVATQATSRPTLSMGGLAFQRIVVDTVNSQQVFFITALNSDSTLVLLKVLITTVNSNRPSYHVISTTVLPTSTDPRSTPAVTKMEMYGNGSSVYIYIGTDEDIYRAPVQDCATTYTTCSQCIAARDPYCAFDPTSESCEPLASALYPMALLQDLVNGDIDTCPLATTTESQSTTEDNITTLQEVTRRRIGSRNETTDAMTVFDSVLDNMVWVIVATVGGFTVGATLGMLVAVIFKRGNGEQATMTDNLAWTIVFTVGSFIVGATLGMLGVIIFKAGNINVIMLNNTVMIIVFAVGGFIMGAILGMLVVIVFKHGNASPRRKKRSKKGEIAPSGQSEDKPQASIVQSKEEAPRLNNSTSDFSSIASSNSGNECNQHLPQHHKHVKYLVAPEQAVKKRIATPISLPEFLPPPGKSRPSTFPPTSIRTPLKSPTSMDGAFSGSCQDRRGDKQSHTDPKLQLNYKTSNMQHEASYGKNILSRIPSINGNYTGPGFPACQVHDTTVPMYTSDTLSWRVTYHRQLQQDTEMLGFSPT